MNLPLNSKELFVEKTLDPAWQRELNSRRKSKAYVLPVTGTVRIWQFANGIHITENYFVIVCKPTMQCPDKINFGIV